jgi:hypothetical protein
MSMHRDLRESVVEFARENALKLRLSRPANSGSFDSGAASLCEAVTALRMTLKL